VAHGIAAAVAAEAIGEVYGVPGMYTFGLTHDLGRLGLFLVRGADYARELSLEFASIAEANAVEQRLYGMTHCQAGALVARAWGFPETLGACMGNHHEPHDGHEEHPENVVSAACRMADALGFLEVPQSEAPPWPELPQALRDHPGLEPETLWDEISRRIAGLAN
jgi:HD-like signal output (HDOD) protein